MKKEVRSYADDVGEVGFHGRAEPDPIFATFQVDFIIRLEFEIPLDGWNEIDDAQPDDSIEGCIKKKMVLNNSTT